MEANRKIVQQVEKSIGQLLTIVSFVNINRLFIGLNGLEEKDIDQYFSKLYHLFKNLDLCLRMAYSLPYRNLYHFHQFYKDCEISGKEKDCAFFAHIEVKSLFHQVDEIVTDRFARLVLKNFGRRKPHHLKRPLKINRILNKVPTSCTCTTIH